MLQLARRSNRLTRLQPASVCIIKPSSLGDVVHSLPILAALRSRWPSAHLAWVVNQEFQDVVREHPDVDELIVYERGSSGNRLVGNWGDMPNFSKACVRAASS